ncbi:MAG: uracil-DNA glycosylase [Syntrophobacter sp.]
MKSMTAKATEKAKKLEKLYSRIQSDPGYRSPMMSDIFVPGRGALDAGAIVLIGEAPGRDEEKCLYPFVGAAGKNLDKLLKEAGILRDDVFITNVVKYRPFSPTGKNRNPSTAERGHALPFLLEELEILAPKLAVCLGLCPARALLGGNPAMRDLNGEVFRKFGTNILVTYHPSPFNFMVASKREEMIRVFRRLRGPLLPDIT